MEGVLDPVDVLLVVSPTAMTDLPSPGVHLLRACCREAGIHIELLYANLLYSRLLGVELHRSISLDWHLLMGERLFAAAAFGDETLALAPAAAKFSDPGWVPDHLWKIKEKTTTDQKFCGGPGGGFSKEPPGRRRLKSILTVPPVPEPVVSFRKWQAGVDLSRLETLTSDWEHDLARRIVGRGYRIVGCSTSCGGLLPCIALLEAVKKANPTIITILGGPLCEGEMAEGIVTLKTHIDYIFSGEGEITFPAFVQQVLAGNPPKERILCGQPVHDLDTIPVPDYRTYLEQV
ncbi:MAG: hypothetical protein EHM45_23660, partial [Desulfobacteraceae bacterium]